MRKYLILLLALVALFALVACDVETGPDDCAGATSLFEDDFSGEKDCGWIEYSRGGAVVAIENEAMQISTSQPGQIWWTNAGQNFDNVIISVEARQLSGPDNNAYGIICRYQNENNFYMFLISGDGYYAIAKYQSGIDQITYLSGDGQYQPSTAINQGIATNQIRASCVNNELSLAVNGIPLETVTDPTFVTGDIGLAVSTLEPGTAVVEFDNVRVFTP